SVPLPSTGPSSVTGSGTSSGKGERSRRPAGRPVVSFTSVPSRRRDVSRNTLRVRTGTRRRRAWSMDRPSGFLRRPRRTFRDRREAGRVLAEQLASYRGKAGLLVLGLARGGVVMNDKVVSSLHITDQQVRTVIDREAAELLRREQAYRGGRPIADPRG